MIINSGTIREAFQSFNIVFNKAFQEMDAQYPRVAMEVPSETRDEGYAWLGAVPSMREWIVFMRYGANRKQKRMRLIAPGNRNNLRKYFYKNCLTEPAF
mgnify:CR=1 FL=1